ncbi:helix-turn-helix domain-containing protein [Treponema socranskii]|uniref:DNA-binding helix-turn-helix protein n=1 Tax=Treponema socranskii subsp. socranskii VPI DR56BR1116 = ATCC 35536 TaxID=1125725 RepID=U1FK84_TRESO|nr:helix-turn-helix domain-containing protein [Treponema socranskii]ERF59766.1 DNA-binding helix-turn-helix protein [Treponema socranskii subsp. socranskii VPI DR56BR1116 = ATCC 35536]
MESYGTILKRSREEKNIDRDTAARETSITVECIRGLEEEDTSAFPGEPYMVGFLRNYAEYLGVNPDTVMSLYRSKAIQESPVPDGLFVKHKSSFFIPIIVGAGIFVVAGAAAILIISKFSRANKNGSVVVAQDMGAKTYELTDKPLEKRLFRGDKIVYPSEKGKIILTVSDTLTSFGLDTPVGTLRTDLAEEAELDVDGDAKSDIIVYVSDISSTEASRGAEVRMLVRRQDSDMLPIDEIAIEDASQNPLDPQRHPQTVILEDNRAYPFTVNASFRGPCEFRYRVDRKRSSENYFTNGEVVMVTANNGVRVWMSNGNTVKFTVVADTKNYDLEIGKAGQVLVEDIKWVRDSEGKYRLVVVELD